uniref:Centrosome and spindle pole associated protein 1a n=1 Tax=Poecilia formosa TaxID=48698 RepID=A0A096MB74_POEFO
GIAALGRDYEKKKQKLLLELQLEYKDYVAKKKDCKSHVPGEQQGLSLPIEERVSVKERLREERQREYNLFLQEQAQNRRAKKGAHLITPKPEHQSSDAVSVASPGSAPSFMNSQTSTPPYQRESPVSVKNAATLTEAGDYRGSPDTWSPCCRRRRRWEVHQPKKTHSSEEELNTEEEEDYDFIPRRRRGRSTNEQECKEEWGTPEHGQRSVIVQEIKHDKIISQTPQNLKTTAKSTPTANQDEKELATGLMIGKVHCWTSVDGCVADGSSVVVNAGAVEDWSVVQMKKEQYKQELLRQMAEQQKNKKKEKKSVLKLGAAEATTPEQQIGAASHQDRSLEQDVSNPLTNFGPNCNQLPLCGMGAMQAVPPFNYCNTFPGIQGQVAIPCRVPVVPPGSHVVSNGDASWYEGPRKQDPYSNQYLSKVSQSHHSVMHAMSSQSLQFSCFNYNNLQNYASILLQGDLEAQKTTDHFELIVSYFELSSQMEELSRRRHVGLPNGARAPALQEGELVVYDPWGKGGGGAPIRDKHGNLVSDLYQMRSFNNKRMTSLGAELESPISLQESSHPSPLQQDRYTEELRQQVGPSGASFPFGKLLIMKVTASVLFHQPVNSFKQIEERKRKKAEERERVRIAEEDEEKKLAMERVRIQQQYEEEKRREKEMRQSKGKQSNKAETHDIEKVLGKERKHHNAPQSVRQNEVPDLFLQREPSPPIPTLQRKQTSLSPSPSSDMSSPTSRIVSRLEVHANIFKVVNLLCGNSSSQQEVIRELSTLRKFLRREQRQLELQL